jgi:hypothetical protein
LYMQPEIEGIEIWDFPLKLIFAWQREWNGWIGFLVVFLHSWVATRLGLFHGFIMSKASCGWRERVNTRARERRWGRKVFASWFSLSGTKKNEWMNCFTKWSCASYNTCGSHLPLGFFS